MERSIFYACAKITVDYLNVTIWDMLYVFFFVALKIFDLFYSFFFFLEKNIIFFAYFEEICWIL